MSLLWCLCLLISLLQFTSFALSPSSDQGVKLLASGYLDWDLALATPVPDSFVGISTTYLELRKYLNDTTFHALMRNLLAYGSPGSVVFRVMGVPKKFPPHYWKQLAKNASAFSTKFMLQIPLLLTKNSSAAPFNPNKYIGSTIISKATLTLGAHKIVGFNLGNEPDWFVYNRGWDKESYFLPGGDFDRDVTNIEEAVAPLLRSKFKGSCRMLSGPESANFWTSFLTTARLQTYLQSHPCIGTVATHHYAGGAKDLSFGPRNLLSSTIMYGAVATAMELVPIASAHHAKYRVTEMGSMFGGGRWGLSDRFAAALWLLEMSMSLALQGTEGTHWNGAGCSANAVVNYGVCIEQASTEGLGSGMRASSIYFGMMMFQMAMGQGALLYKAEVRTDEQDVSIWGFKSTSCNRRRIVVINRSMNASGYVTLALAGSHWKSATLCRLSATSEPPERAPAEQVKLCGQHIGAGGKLEPANPVLEQVVGAPLGGAMLQKPIMSYTFWVDRVSAVLLEVKAQVRKPGGLDITVV